jgi:hypothetical protein
MTKMPPVPPANRSNKGPGADPAFAMKDGVTTDKSNIDQKDRQGNIKQNTTNQGYQQDR